MIPCKTTYPRTVKLWVFSVSYLVARCFKFVFVTLKYLFCIYCPINEKIVQEPYVKILSEEEKSLYFLHLVLQTST